MFGIVIALGRGGAVDVVAVRPVDAVADHAAWPRPAAARSSRAPRAGSSPARCSAACTLGGAIAGAAIALGAVGLERHDRDRARSRAARSPRRGGRRARCFGFGPPFLCRQVNEAWLSKYRPWVYGGGFGWQIGAGVTTYVMTAAVPLHDRGRRARARTRGPRSRSAPRSASRAASRCCSARACAHRPRSLAFHRRFDAWAEPVRQAVIGVQLAVAVIAAWIVAPVVVAAA